MKILPTLYANWAKSCLASAIFVFVLLLSTLNVLDTALFLIWLQFVVYLVHEFEEHVFPGGFKNFINQVVFKSVTPNFPLNDSNVFWINIPFIWVAFPLFAILAQHVNLQFGAVPAYFGLFNATVHIIAGIAKRRYNPGLIVSIVLNYPTGIYTLWYLAHIGVLTLTTNLLAFAFAFFGHLVLVIFIIRKWRAQKHG